MYPAWWLSIASGNWSNDNNIYKIPSGYGKINNSKQHRVSSAKKVITVWSNMPNVWQQFTESSFAEIRYKGRPPKWTSNITEWTGLKLCDVLTIAKDQEKWRSIALGLYSHHYSLDYRTRQSEYLLSCLHQFWLLVLLQFRSTNLHLERACRRLATLGRRRVAGRHEMSK